MVKSKNFTTLFLSVVAVSNFIGRCTASTNSLRGAASATKLTGRPLMQSTSKEIDDADDERKLLEGTTIHDNYLHLWLDATQPSKTNLTATGKLSNIKCSNPEHSITSGQPWNGFTVYGGTKDVAYGLSYDVKAGRHKTSGPAEFFNKNLTAANMIGAYTQSDFQPGNLNFATSCDLSFEWGGVQYELKGKTKNLTTFCSNHCATSSSSEWYSSDAHIPYSLFMIQKDFRTGQGSTNDKMTGGYNKNNWWVGWSGCEYKTGKGCVFYTEGYEMEPAFGCLKCPLDGLDGTKTNMEIFPYLSSYEFGMALEFIDQPYCPNAAPIDEPTFDFNVVTKLTDDNPSIGSMDLAIASLIYYPAVTSVTPPCQYVVQNEGPGANSYESFKVKFVDRGEYNTTSYTLDPTELKNRFGSDIEYYPFGPGLFDMADIRITNNSSDTYYDSGLYISTLKGAEFFLTLIPVNATNGADLDRVVVHGYFDDNGNQKMETQFLQGSISSNPVYEEVCTIDNGSDYPYKVGYSLSECYSSNVATFVCPTNRDMSNGGLNACLPSTANSPSAAIGFLAENTQNGPSPVSTLKMGGFPGSSYLTQWNKLGNGISGEVSVTTTWSTDSTMSTENQTTTTFTAGLTNVLTIKYLAASDTNTLSTSYTKNIVTDTTTKIEQSQSTSTTLSCTTTMDCSNGVLYQWQVSANTIGNSTDSSIQTCWFACVDQINPFYPSCPAGSCSSASCKCCNQFWDESNQNLALIDHRTEGLNGTCIPPDDDSAYVPPGGNAFSADYIW